MKYKGSILIVDDEKSVLEIMDQYLSEYGYQVVTVLCGREALDLLDNREFDAALIDLKLPDFSGLELIKKCNKLCPGMKCIVMTAFASQESTIEALRMNVFDYILKPFDLVKIAEVIDAAVSHQLLIRENTNIIRRLEEANKRLEKSKSDLNKRILKTNVELEKANESLKRHVTRLKILFQMGRDISSNENWSDALDRFLMAICQYLDADGTALLMFSDGGRILQVRTSYNLEEAALGEAVDTILEIQRKDNLQHEMFSLESCVQGRPVACLNMRKKWNNTVIPLLYKGRWLGFLIIQKNYRSRGAYLNDYHFINTIQTILTEEVANAVNISRLRNLKDFNATILENINSGVLKTDRSGNVVFVNGRAKEILGSDTDSQHFNDLFENPFGNDGLFEYLIARGEKNCSLEGILSLRGKKRVPVRVNSTVVEMDEYQGPAIVAVFEDLTDQKRMEEELRRADRLRSLGELSAGVAHEIRNPLTGIATTAQVLKEQLHGEAEKIKYLTVILDEIKRLDDIIRNLLGFARPVSPRPVEVSLTGIIEETMNLLIDRARERRVSMHFENDLENDRCFLDGDQMKQVILNIATNGIEACADGGALTIYSTASTDPACVRIEFLDDGEGVPEEVADKLYNPFFTTRPEGTGLGLSISRKIVESHGGRIFHREGESRGTRFIIEIPRKIVAPSTKETARVS
ncbi:MAG: response regulator [Candidatus Krumholzibacteriota bacterium]|nr:response regulator [Candidatus Krumholzibacteriota bacterium]